MLPAPSARGQGTKDRAFRNQEPKAFLGDWEPTGGQREGLFVSKGSGQVSYSKDCRIKNIIQSATWFHRKAGQGVCGGVSEKATTRSTSEVRAALS